MKKYQTTAVNVLTDTLNQLAVYEYELKETVSPNRIDIRLLPQLREDFHCLVGKGGATFWALRALITKVAIDHDQKVVTWPNISEPNGNDDFNRPKEEYFASEMRQFVERFAMSIFGSGTQVEYKDATSKTVSVIITHPQSREATEISEAFKAIINLILRVHGKKCECMLFASEEIESYFDQPKTADGRFSKES